MKFIFMMFLLPQIVLAQGPVRDIANIDMKDSLDESGSWLIYDCSLKHWECVKEETFKECEEKVQSDARNESFRHTCAPVGQLESIRACQQRILFLTSNNYGTNFCIKEEWTLKPIGP